MSSNSQSIDLQCKQFSYSNKSILTNTDNITASLKDLYNLITNPTKAQKAKLVRVQNIARNLYEGNLSATQAAKLKTQLDYLKKDLGFYFPSGTNPNGHRAKDLVFNGFIGLDIDYHHEGGYKKAKTTKAALSKFDFIPFLHHSSGNNGVKGVVLTDLKECDSDLYQFAQRQIFAYLSEQGIDLGNDKHAYGKTCFLSFDKDAYLCDTATPFHIDLDAYEAEKQAIQERVSYTTSNHDNKDIAKQAIKYLIDNNICVASCYDEYVGFTAACINTFDESGSDIAFEVLMCSEAFRISSFKSNFETNAKSIYKSNLAKKVKSTDNGKKTDTASLGSILYHAFGAGFQYVQPIARTADTIVEALEGEKLTDVLKRLNITPNQLDKVKLIAPTGLGKGFLVNWIANTTDESVILVCPNTLLVMQFAERYGFTPFYANTDPELIRGAKKIAVTYHSFARLSNLINVPEFRVFLDESQNFTSGSSQSYLLKPLHSVLNCIQNRNFKSVTFLTGTDIFNFHPYFEQFKTLEITAARKAIAYTITDCKDVLAAAAAKAIEAIQTKVTPIIFLNNKGNKLSKLKTLLGQTKVAVINADEKGSNDFDNIVKNGLISNDVECLICTSSLKEGNDILNNYSFDFIVVDTKIGSIELRQLVGRARNAQGITLHILKSENREKSIFAYNIRKRRAKLEKQANDECLELNMSNYDFSTNQLAEKVRKGVQNVAIRINENNVFEVDYLLLSNMIYSELVSCEYANDNYQQTNLERLGFKLWGNATNTAETDVNIKNDLKAIAITEKQVYETEYTQHIETLQAVPDVQKQIELMQTGSKIAKLIVDRVEKLQDEFPLSPAECVEMIATMPKKSDFKLLIDRIRVNNYLIGVTDDTNLSIFYKSLKNKFKVGEYYTPNEIREKVLKSVDLLKTVDLSKFDKDKERNTNILKELRKVFEVKAISHRIGERVEKVFRIENVTLVCLNNFNQTKVTDFKEVFEDAPF